MNQKTYSKRI